MAAVCCVYTLVRLTASYLPLVVYLPLAAVFLLLLIIAVIRRKNKMSIIISSVCVAALAIQALSVFVVSAIFAMAGSEHSLTVEVKSLRSGYVDGTNRAVLLVTHADGEQLHHFERFSISCDRFEGQTEGEVYQGIFELRDLEKDQYYYSNLSDNIFLEAGCKKMEYLGDSKALHFQFQKLNRKFSDGIQKYLPDKEGAILAAMSVGDKSNLTPRIQSDFRRAGVSHLLVVSGLHLSLLCGAFLGNRPIRGRHRRLKSGAAMLLVVFLMALTGGTPSIMRAGTAALIFYFGALAMMPADSFTSLGVAAVLAGFSGPYAYCNLGLQLSFAATIGVIMASTFIHKMENKKVNPEHKFEGLVITCLALIVCPFMAALFTLPIQLANGLAISGVSVITNLLITIITGPILCLGFAAGLSSLIPGLDFAVRVFALCGGLLVRLMTHIVEFCGSLPFAELRIPRGFGLWLWVAGAIAATVLVRNRASKAHWCKYVTTIVIAAAVYISLCHGTVSVSLLGGGAVPAVAIRENNECIVLYQGGAKNQTAIHKFMEDEKLSKINLLVDLRDKPSSLDLPAETIILAEKLDHNTDKSYRNYDILTTVMRLEKCNIAVADIAGLKITVTTGKDYAGSALKTDFLITGTALTGQVRAKTIVSSAKAKNWQYETESPVYFASENCTIKIRPRTSVTLSGGCYDS